METLSRLTNVWYSIFIREVLACGRPIPGYSIPRALPSSAVAANTRPKINIFDAESLFESADLEARTLLALRLDKRWCKSGSSTPNTDATVTTTSFKPLTDLPVENMFLLPGGRYLVLVHVDGLRLWDLQFPVPTAFHDVTSSPYLAETWLFDETTPATIFDTVFDAATRPAWGGKSSFFFSYCTKPCDGPILPLVNLFSLFCSAHYFISRTVSIVSLTHASLKLSNNDVDIDEGVQTTSSTSSRAFSLKREIILPSSLSPPRDSGVSTSGSINYGTLGRLIHMHSQFLIYESFAPIPIPRTEVGDNSPRDQYVGIEVLDWTNPDTIANTTLLVYPGPEVCSRS